MVNVKHKWNTVQNNTFLLLNYPGLSFTTANEIVGELKFRAFYDKVKCLILINPALISNDHYLIEDTYSINIKLPDDPEKFLPLVYETGNRIVESGKKYNITDFRDLHIYKDGSSVCLCPQPQFIERILNGKSKSLPLLIDELIIPFFYQQSYFERYGDWPIKNFSHGYPAIFEYYLRKKNNDENNNQLQLRLCIASLKTLAQTEPNKYLVTLVESRKAIKSTSKCFCGSGRKYKKCHRRTFSKEAKAGFITFLSDIRKS